MVSKVKHWEVDSPSKQREGACESDNEKMAASMLALSLTTSQVLQDVSGPGGAALLWQKVVGLTAIHPRMRIISSSSIRIIISSSITVIIFVDIGMVLGIVIVIVVVVVIVIFSIVIISMNDGSLKLRIV